MDSTDPEDDLRAIEAIVARQFGSLNWTPGTAGDWDAFAADFVPGAALYPSARPAKRQSVEAFVERMQGLAGTKLRSFRESVLGTKIQIFGNVAMALAACEIVENDSATSRGVEILLLVKDAGAWKIVAQAWDNAGEARPVPDFLLGGGALATTLKERA